MYLKPWGSDLSEQEYELPDELNVSPSYRNRNRKYHIHRKSAWQDPTGESRHALCGVQIGPARREVKASGVKRSKYRFCKSCVRLFKSGGQ